MNTPADKNDSPASEGYSRPLDIPGTAAFQRPGATGPQTPRVPGSTYTPGTYGASTATAYGSSPSPSAATGSARRLVVGEGINMSGEIDSCDTLIVEGTVEAALKGASILDIAETGMFYGTVEIDECTIAGRFEGDITVHGRLTVKASGSITGSIAYKELAVEAGATVDGKLSPLNANGKKSEKKDVKPGKKLGSAQGSELPFAAGHASAAE
jgi:cytoskeletal protein CcmA (bactofilin family)